MCKECKWEEHLSILQEALGDAEYWWAKHTLTHFFNKIVERRHVTSVEASIIHSLLRENEYDSTGAGAGQDVRPDPT